MTGCKDFQKIMQKVLDRTASEKERADLEGHMTLCRDCARKFKTLQVSLELLISMPVPEPSPTFTSDTIKKAFRAKRDQKRRRKIASWCLSGLTAIISVFIIAGWNMVLQPAIRNILLNLLKIILEWRALFNALNKILSAMVTVLKYLADVSVRIIWEGGAPIVSGYLIALILMVFIILMSGARSSAFSFKRR